MAKRKRVKSGKSNKSKYVVIGAVIAVIAVIIGIIVALSSDSSLDNGDKLTIDTRNGSPVLGDESAPVTIIEFGDYQCPFCRKWNQETKPLIEQNYIQTGKAKLIYVDLAILGPDSIKAHAGSYCADEQGLYWTYHDYLYKNQGHENDGWAKQENLKSLVSGIHGLDMETFENCLDSKKYENRVTQNKSVATKNGAKSTPSFIIIGADGKGIPISGAQPYSIFKMAIDEKLGV